MKIINRLFGRKPLLAKKAFVRVSDTADGLLIHSEDAKALRLIPDHPYRGEFLPDGRYRIELTGREIA